MQPTADADARSRWLGDLLDAHGPGLALYAAQWCSAPDDCVQEALVSLAAQQPTPDNPVAWLYRAVKNRAISYSRSEGRRTVRELGVWRERLASSNIDEQRRELLDAVALLPDEMREVVLLKTWGRLSLDEMAETLGESRSTLHRRYQSALERLRKLWELPCPESTKTT